MKPLSTESNAFLASRATSRLLMLDSSIMARIERILSFINRFLRYATYFISNFFAELFSIGFCYYLMITVLECDWPPVN